ncbi:hypothetical protein THAOC_21531, partial [Thalassiosira oceanica]
CVRASPPGSTPGPSPAAPPAAAPARRRRRCRGSRRGPGCCRGPARTGGNSPRRPPWSSRRTCPTTTIHELLQGRRLPWGGSSLVRGGSAALLLVVILEPGVLADVRRGGPVADACPPAHASGVRQAAGAGVPAADRAALAVDVLQARAPDLEAITRVAVGARRVRGRRRREGGQEQEDGGRRYQTHRVVVSTHPLCFFAPSCARGYARASLPAHEASVLPLQTTSSESEQSLLCLDERT